MKDSGIACVPEDNVERPTISWIDDLVKAAGNAMRWPMTNSGRLSAGNNDDF